MLWIKIVLLSALPLTLTAERCALFASHPHHVHRRWPAFESELLRLRLGRSGGSAATVLPAAPGGRDADDAAASTATELTRRQRRSWEESFALLCEYRDVHGHCNVPQSEKPLGTWVNTQRIEHSRYLSWEGMLPKHDGKDQQVNNGSSLPRTSMNAQRKKFMDDIGFVWDAMEHAWDTRYEELCEFCKTNGHCAVPRSNGRLGAWVEKQRIEYKKYRAMEEINQDEQDQKPKTILTKDRVKKMDDIGFVWDVRENQFEQKLGQLRIFQKINGHIDPRFMDGSLALWVRKWDQQYGIYLDAAAARIDADTLSEMLPDNRRVALESVGFSKNMHSEPRARSVKNRRASWEERYEELKEYKAEHGHCVVPKNDGHLGSWVRAQRHLMKEKLAPSASFESGGLLSPERVDRLNELGFVWDVHQWQWNQKYHELLQYKEEHNNTNVPMSYGGLGLWVFNQRADCHSYQKGKQSGMTPERLDMLKDIGFEFDLGKKIQSAADERWKMRFNELKEYGEKWGTIKVKQTHNPSLYTWCQNQKACWKRSKLKREREKSLQSIGFLQ